MAIELSPEQQRLIELAVESGAYKSSSEVLDQAFEILREQLAQESWMRDFRGEIGAHIARGFAQAERGELTDGNTALEALRRGRQNEPKPHE